MYSLLGTTYGGDGRTTFGLPDLRGRAPVHFGTGPGLTNISRGEHDGAETETVLTENLPSHHHTVNATTVAANADDASGQILAKAQSNTSGGSDVLLYDPKTTLKQMSTEAITDTGGSQSHSNMQPYLAINFCIALVGTFPPRN